MSSLSDIGIYGKLPSHGDFLRRRVPEEFVRVWDPWLQECLTASRTDLMDTWLDRYLTSPVWRFACAAGAAGPTPVIGLMAPSVDRVGRYFPLTLMAEVPAAVDPLTAARGATSFFERAERLVIDTLAAARVDFELFDSQIVELSRELSTLNLSPEPALDFGDLAVMDGSGTSSWHLPLGEPPALGPVFDQMLARHLAAAYEPLVIWWTDGSTYVDPSCLVRRGLPDPTVFAAMLDGDWSNRSWCSIPTRSSGGGSRSADAETLTGDLLGPQFRSAAVSDVGKVRSVNQDAYLERGDVGVWVVADGLGGHSAGEVASRMVCDAFSDFVPVDGFDQMIDTARERLEQVNGYLVRMGASADSGGCGSTVVALFARGSRCAILWAGDSRLYRFREGELHQLTRDHSLAEVDAAAATGQNRNAVTRAVGGETTLALDQRREQVRAGDRFLLCSDGLTRSLSDAEIGAWMEQIDIREAATALVEATLDKGAPDNVTALIVEAYF